MNYTGEGARVGEGVPWRNGGTSITITRYFSALYTIYSQHAFGYMLDCVSKTSWGARRLLRGDTLIPAFDLVEGRCVPRVF